MDIWLSRCNKRAKCSYCGEYVTVGEPEVFGKLWLRGKGEESKPRKFVKRFHWHAQRKLDGKCCWLEQALNELSKRIHVETRGRHKLLLPADVRAARLKILQRRAKVVQQIREESEKAPKVRDMNRIIRLGCILAELKEKIEPLGGVPVGW